MVEPFFTITDANLSRLAIIIESDCEISFYDLGNFEAM